MMLLSDGTLENLKPSKLLDSSLGKRKRNIYVTSYPFYEGFGEFPTITLLVLLVNKSVQFNSSMLNPPIDNAKWIYLKSYYIFSTTINGSPNNSGHLFELFNNNLLFPMFEMTTGYYEDRYGVSDLGMSVFDLDASDLMNSGQTPLKGVHSDRSYIPVIDPRYYSEKEHFLNLSCYPDDFCPKFQYYGSELMDEDTTISPLESASIPRLTFGSNLSKSNTSSSVLPAISTKSWYLADLMSDIANEESFGAIERGEFSYDSDFGVGMSGVYYPSVLPRAFAKNKVAIFLNNFRKVIKEKESYFGGKVRIVYVRGDVVDIIRVISLNAGADDPTRIMTYKVFREEMIRDVFFRKSYIASNKEVVR